ncbi:hypothetical protein ABT346_13390 [Micromonospora peucetia]|uniref:Cap15 family cyclic dinucleotide receptor domain-containing protein n=1 Tax=Micromonospora peucetia TaxID=47871 RepID=UPI003325F746
MTPCLATVVPSPAWTRIVVFLAAGIWLLLALVLGVPVDQAWLRYLGAVAAVAVILILAFDLFAWRWLPYWLVKRPMLRGTWKARLRSSWLDSDGHQVEKTCYIVIDQTFSKVSIAMIFDISDSTSVAADIVSEGSRPILSCTYRSSAHALSQSDNPPHRGALSLYVAMSSRVSLEGDYWTERKTTGRIATVGRSKKLAGSHKEAEALSFH